MSDLRNVCSAQKLNAWKPEEQAKYFLRLLRSRDLDTANRLSEHIYYLVEEQAVPLRVYSILINVVVKLHPSFNLIATIQQVGRQLYLQEELIYILSRLLRRKQWRETWNAAGGVDAIGATCTFLAPRNLRILAKKVGHGFAKPWRRTPETEQAMEQLLLYALRNDGRPLEQIYAFLVPATSDTFLRQFETKTRDSLIKQHVNVFDLVYSHASLYRHAILTLDENIVGFASAIIPLLKELHTNYQNIPGFVPHNSKQFALKILGKMAGRSFQLSPSFDKGWFKSLVRCVLPDSEGKPPPNVDKLMILEFILKVLEDDLDMYGGLEYDIAPILGATLTQWIIAYQQDSTTMTAVDDMFQAFCDPKICDKAIWDSVERFLSSYRPRKERGSRKSSYKWLEAVFDFCPVNLRYNLLHKVIQNLHPKNVDIEKEKDVARLKRAHLWQPALFLAMDLESASNLLHRLRRVPKDTNFLVHGHPVFGGHTDQGDALLLYIDDSARKTASDIIQSYRRNAETSNGESDRLNNAFAAFESAIGSQSLSLYTETLRWSRRFIKDRTNFQDLYESDLYTSPELQELLIGFSKHASMPEIQNHVEAGTLAEANNILQLHTDLLESAMEEPSFKGKWSKLAGKIRALISSVVLWRVYYIFRFRASPGFEELVQKVIEPTFELLLAHEKAELDHHDERRLDIKKARVLNGIKGAVIKDAPAAIRLSLDKYLQQKDQMWKQYRALASDRADSIPEIIPRGLPVQFLLPSGIRLEYIGDMKFFKRRIFEAIDVVKDVSGKATKRLKDLKGDHFDTWPDSYLFSMSLALRAVREDERKALLEEYWTHCKKMLQSTQNLTPYQEWYWRGRFLALIGETMDPETNPKEYMTITGLENKTEWTPTNETSAPQRHSYLTVFNAMLETGRGNHDPETSLTNTATMDEIPRSEYHQIWPWEGYSHLPYTQGVRDAYVLSSLLFLDSYLKQKTMLLSQPFPSEGNQRLPAVYLEAEFLSHLQNKDHLGDVARRVLRKLRMDLPTKLLAQQLNRWLENSTSDKDNREADTIAYSVLKVLNNSDTPGIAIPFIKEIIVNRPHASSWVRQILTPRVLRRLPPVEAKALIGDLLAELSERLERQRLKKPTTSSDESSKAQPAVKLSTLKHLIMLIRTSEMMSGSEAVDLLSKVLDSTNHSDIQAAVSNGLITLMGCMGNEVAKIFQVLQKVIPRVSGPQERRYPNGKMLESSENDDLPETYSDSSFRPPVMRLLFLDSKELIPTSLRAEFVKQILLPVYDLSCRQHQLWLRRFVELNGGSQDEHLQAKVANYLPKIPFHQFISDNLLSEWTEYLPQECLESFADSDLYYMQLSELRNIDQTVAENFELRISNAGKHWKNLREEQKSGCGLARHLCSRSESFGKAQFDESMLLIIRLAETHLQNAFAGSTTALKRISTLLATFTDPLSRISAHTGKLKGESMFCRKVLPAIVDIIERSRTTEWNINGDRQPQCLPSTLRSRLVLLHWPCKADSETSEGAYENLAKHLRELVHEIVLSQMTYHQELRIILECYRDICSRGKSTLNLSLAVALSTFEQQVPSSTVDMLLLEIAITALELQKFKSESGSNINQDHIDTMHERVESWKRCANEQAREWALKAEKKLQKLHSERSSPADYIHVPGENIMYRVRRSSSPSSLDSYETLSSSFSGSFSS